MVHAIDKYYATLFAYLVGRLDSFTEGDVKLLDNTATVWFQEMSDGNSHNLNNMPILQAGSCGGYFKTGQAINVEGGATDMSPGNSDEDCANGQSPFNNLDGVGTPSTVATHADQQVLLQPAERDRREGRRDRLRGPGRHGAGHQVRQVRRHEAVLRRRDRAATARTRASTRSFALNTARCPVIVCPRRIEVYESSAASSERS